MNHISITFHLFTHEIQYNIITAALCSLKSNFAVVQCGTNHNISRAELGMIPHTAHIGSSLCCKTSPLWILTISTQIIIKSTGISYRWMSSSLLEEQFQINPVLFCFYFIFLKSKSHREFFVFFINWALTIFPKTPAISLPYDKLLMSLGYVCISLESQPLVICLAYRRCWASLALTGGQRNAAGQLCTCFLNADCAPGPVGGGEHNTATPVGMCGDRRIRTKFPTRIPFIGDRILCTQALISESSLSL